MLLRKRSKTNYNETDSIASDESSKVENANNHKSNDSEENASISSSSSSSSNGREDEKGNVVKGELQDNNNNNNNVIIGNSLREENGLTEASVKLWMSEITKFTREDKEMEEKEKEDVVIHNNNNNNDIAENTISIPTTHNNNNNDDDDESNNNNNNNNMIVPSDVLHGSNDGSNEITEEDAVLWMKDIMMDDHEEFAPKNDSSNNNDDEAAAVVQKKSDWKSDMKRVLKEAEDALEEATKTLDDARHIAEEVGLTVDSSILDASYQSPFLPTKFVHGVTLQSHDHHTTTTPQEDSTTKRLNNTDNPMRGRFNAFPLILSTTGGHSNTDHLIQCTGDVKMDRLAEYKRRLKRRARAMQPEQKGAHRWDQPRVAGGRRRRILREKDLPSAPPEPPPSGYIIFIGQMTTKIRHDRPNVHHNQISVVREISKIWKYGMSSHDREYYNEFSKEAREEYKQQLREFRATGNFHPSKVFSKMDGGPWIRIAYHEKNALEREIASYSTVQFPPRPQSAPVPHWVRKIEQQTARQKLRVLQRQKKKEQQQQKQQQAKKRKTPPSRTSPRIQTSKKTPTSSTPPSKTTKGSTQKKTTLTSSSRKRKKTSTTTNT